MKKIVKFLFIIYHSVFASSVGCCRFRPTCSEYAVYAIEEYGIFTGSFYILRRLLSCHPFSRKPIYDPLPVARLSNRQGKQEYNL